MLKEKSKYFADRIGGEIIRFIDGNFGSMSAKVEKDSEIYYVFSAREWYRKYNGITIPESILNLAVKDHAMIVVFLNDDEYWLHSSVWRNGRVLRNPMFGKIEVLATRDQLNTPDSKNVNGLDSFIK